MSKLPLLVLLLSRLQAVETVETAADSQSHSPKHQPACFHFWETQLFPSYPPTFCRSGS